MSLVNRRYDIAQAQTDTHQSILYRPLLLSFECRSQPRSQLNETIFRPFQSICDFMSKGSTTTGFSTIWRNGILIASCFGFGLTRKNSCKLSTNAQKITSSKRYVAIDGSQIPYECSSKLGSWLRFLVIASVVYTLPIVRVCKRKNWGLRSRKLQLISYCILHRTSNLSILSRIPHTNSKCLAWLRYYKYHSTMISKIIIGYFVCRKKLWCSGSCVVLEARNTMGNSFAMLDVKLTSLSPLAE